MLHWEDFDPILRREILSWFHIIRTLSKLAILSHIFQLFGYFIGKSCEKSELSNSQLDKTGFVFFTGFVSSGISRLCKFAFLPPSPGQISLATLRSWRIWNTQTIILCSAFPLVIRGFPLFYGLRMQAIQYNPVFNFINIYEQLLCQ